MDVIQLHNTSSEGEDTKYWAEHVQTGQHTWASVRIIPNSKYQICARYYNLNTSDAN